MNGTAARGNERTEGGLERAGGAEGWAGSRAGSVSSFLQDALLCPVPPLESVFMRFKNRGDGVCCISGAAARSGVALWLWCTAATAK